MTNLYSIMDPDGRINLDTQIDNFANTKQNNLQHRCSCSHEVVWKFFILGYNWLEWFYQNYAEPISVHNCQSNSIFCRVRQSKLNFFLRILLRKFLRGLASSLLFGSKVYRSSGFFYFLINNSSANTSKSGLVCWITRISSFGAVNFELFDRHSIR